VYQTDIERARQKFSTGFLCLQLKSEEHAWKLSLINYMYTFGCLHFGKKCTVHLLPMWMPVPEDSRRCDPATTQKTMLGLIRFQLFESAVSSTEIFLGSLDNWCPLPACTNLYACVYKFIM
jgi:hypothetical protein